MILLQTW